MVITADRPEIAGTADLLTRARAGEASAFCQLAAEHERRLLQQACGLTRDPSAAEDLVSETLVEAWRSLSRYNGACRFSTWLFSILLHRHQKALRRARSRPIPLAALPSGRSRPAPTGPGKPSWPPAPLRLRRPCAGRRRTRCGRRSRPCRRSISASSCCASSRMRPCRKSPRCSDCSVGTVKSRLHYALEKLREAQPGVNLSELWGDT